jgi:hypothetical protein
MSEADYYPAGAYSDPNAPYNEPIIPERDFDIDVEFVMSKTVTVTTNDYSPEYDDEDGRENANTENTDWEEAYDNSGHLTIAEMLQELESYVKDDMTKTAPNSGKGRYLQRVLESCQGWEVKEKTFEY